MPVASLTWSWDDQKCLTYPAGGGTKLPSAEKHGRGPISPNADLYLKIAREAKNPRLYFPSETLKPRAEVSPSGPQVAALRNARRGPGGSEALKGAPAAQGPLSLIINSALLSLSHNPQWLPGWGLQRMACQHF